MGARNDQICLNFCYFAVDQEKAVFKRKRAVSCPSALWEARYVKLALDFCYCAVDQEKAVFKRKRDVSCPSAFLGPEMIKSALNFCYCAVDQEKAVFKRKRDVSCPSAFGARNGQICLGSLLLCCRPRKGRFEKETDRFWPVCLFGARKESVWEQPRICLGAARNQQEPVWEQPKKARTCLGESAECLELIWEKPPKRPFLGPCKGSSGWRQGCPTFRFGLGVAERGTLGPPARRECSSRVPGSESKNPWV